jgi:hypothetical protein
MATSHACDLTRGIERADRLEMLVEHAALEVGLGTAEILARERKDLNGIIRRRIERLRRLERLAEVRLPLEPLLASLIVALDGGEECRHVDLHPFRQLGKRVGLADEG